MVKFLIEKNANTTISTESGLTALMVAAYVDKAGFQNSLFLLVNPKLASDWTIWKPLKVNIAEELLKTNCNVNELNCRGETALHVAARTENGSEVLEYLLKNGAGVNIKGPEASPVLHLAARSGNEAVVKKLIEHGADIDAEV